jgi:SAM-dependent methyltransferase
MPRGSWIGVSGYIDWQVTGFMEMQPKQRLDNALTDKTYWEQGYVGANLFSELASLDDYRESPLRKMIDLIVSVGITNKKVLEVGAGNSSILLLLAKYYGHAAKFWGLDYTKSGCESLSARASVNDLIVEVIHGDMFLPDEHLKGSFDVVYSVGVAEHFVDLPSVIQALKQFLKPGGILITLIPNMQGIIGYSTKRMNRVVYELHNPHDIKSMMDAHRSAGLAVLRANYLCSNNFGVLSSCVSSRTGMRWNIYLYLSRISKLIWMFERRFWELPRSRLFSPYLYTIAKKIGS